MTSYTITYRTGISARGTYRTRTATVCGTTPTDAVATFQHMYPGATTTGIRATHLPHTHGANTPYAVPYTARAPHPVRTAIGHLARLVALVTGVVVAACVLGVAAVWISGGIGQVPDMLPHGDTYQYHQSDTCPTEDSCDRFGQPVIP